MNAGIFCPHSKCTRMVKVITAYRLTCCFRCHKLNECLDVFLTKTLASGSPLHSRDGTVQLRLAATCWGGVYLINAHHLTLGPNRQRDLHTSAYSRSRVPFSSVATASEQLMDISRAVSGSGSSSLAPRKQ